MKLCSDRDPRDLKCAQCYILKFSVSLGNLYCYLKFCQYKSTKDHQGHLVIKQVAFVTHCSKREHTSCRTMGYLSKKKKKKKVRKKLLLRFGLLCDFREGLREWRFALGAVGNMEIC